MKSKKYSRKKNYCASSGSGTRRRFRGGMLDQARAAYQRMFGTTPPTPTTEEARATHRAEKEETVRKDTETAEKEETVREETKKAEAEEARDKAKTIGEKRIYDIKTQDDENSISDELKSMEKGQDSVHSEIKMSDAEEHYKKLAQKERAKEEKELDKELTGLEKESPPKSAAKKSKMEFLKDTEKAKIEKFPEAINRSIKLKNVKIPSGKKRRTFENGTSVETNDKRLRRLLSQITEFTEPGDDITLENVDLDFDGHKKMFELSEKYGDTAVQRGFELISLAVATIATNELLPFFVVPLANPILQYFKSELTSVIGLFRFNMGLVLQIVETIYESQNRLRRLKNKESYERFNVDDSKKERTIEEYAKHQAIQGKADAMKLNQLIGSAGKDTEIAPLPSAKAAARPGAAQGAAQSAAQVAKGAKEVLLANKNAVVAEADARTAKATAAVAEADARTAKAMKQVFGPVGGGGTQLPYDQYADTGYNTGTSFFAFEGDMGGRFDNTFTPTAEQSSFFKSIDYYDKV